jgi:DNA repair protein RadA/Sms
LLAVLSSYRDRPLSDKLVVFGELGLAGEVRPVPNGEERLKEAAKHGFTRALVPAANAPRRNSIPDLEITAIRRVSEVLDFV